VTAPVPKRIRGPVAPSTDKTVPTEYVGTLEPKYYCLAWNGKRAKYCRARAGARTDHVGVGRCYHHSGTKSMKHGRYATVKHPRIAALQQAFEADADPLNLEPEVAMLRATVAFWVENAPGEVDASQIADLARLLDYVGKMVERIEKIRVGSHISDHPEFRRITGQMAQVVMGALTGLPDAAERVLTVSQGWNAIPR
jgi:hypothetical protein